MSYWVDIDVENKTSNSITTTIPKGTVLEDASPNLVCQCLVVEKDITIILPPQSRKIVKIPTYCMNRDLSPPTGQPGHLTPFLLNQPFSSQQDVWDHISRRGSR
jgi:hypothetical protein